MRFLTNVTVLLPPTATAAASPGGRGAGSSFADAPPLPPPPLRAADGNSEILVAVLDANLTAVLAPGWNRTDFVSADAQYSVLASSLAVDVLGWQRAAAWAVGAAVRARAASLCLSALWEAHASVSVRPWFALKDAELKVLDRWVALSADVELAVPPEPSPEPSPAPPEPPLPPPPSPPSQPPLPPSVVAVR